MRRSLPFSRRPDPKTVGGKRRCLQAHPALPERALGSRPEPALRSRPSGDDPLRKMTRPACGRLSFVCRGLRPPDCKGQAPFGAPAGRIPDLPPVGRADRVIPLTPPSALTAEPPLIGADLVGCMRNPSFKEGREEGPWSHGPRFKQEGVTPCCNPYHSHRYSQPPRTRAGRSTARPSRALPPASKPMASCITLSSVRSVKVRKRNSRSSAGRGGLRR